MKPFYKYPIILFILFFSFNSDATKNGIELYYESCWQGGTLYIPCIWRVSQEHGFPDIHVAKQACDAWAHAHSDPDVSCGGGGYYHWTGGRFLWPNCPLIGCGYLDREMRTFHYQTCPAGLLQDPDEGCLSSNDDEGSCPISAGGSNPPGSGRGNPTPIAANPINIGSGNKFELVNIPISNRLKFQLAYNSHLDYNPDGTLKNFNVGVGWTHNFASRAEIYTVNGQNKFIVQRPDGREYRYFYDGSVWTPVSYDHATSQWVNNPNIKDQASYDIDPNISLLEAQNIELFTINNTIETYNSNGNLLKVQRLEDGYTEIYDFNLGNKNVLRVDIEDTDEHLIFIYSGLALSSLQHSSGRTWQFTYDNKNNLETIIFPDSTVQTFHYDNTSFDHALTGVTDRRGGSVKYSTFAYDSQYRAILSQHANDANGQAIEKVSVNYLSGNQREVTNSRGKVTTYTLENKNNRWMTTDISGPGCAGCASSNTTYEYDSNNNVTSKTHDGLITKYFNYDNKGQYAYKIEAYGTTEQKRTDYTYDPRFFHKAIQIKEPSVAINLFKITDIVYNDRGQMTSRTISGYDTSGNPIQSRTTTYQYNGELNQISQVDGPRTDVSDITTFKYYDPANTDPTRRNRLKRVTGPGGMIERNNIRWSTTGKITAEDRPNGISIANTYYPLTDRLETSTITSASDNTSITTRYTYLQTGQTRSITTYDGTPEAYTMTMTYDAGLRLIKVEDQLSNYVEYTLDTEGNQTYENTYDSNGLLKNTIHQVFNDYNYAIQRTESGITTNYTYLSDGVIEDMTNGNTVSTDFAHDALKRLTQISQDHNGSNSQTANSYTSFAYNAHDNVKEIIDARGNSTKYKYDDLGNLIQLESPDTGITNYTYDTAGNRISQTDANGVTTTMSYDAYNRPLTKDYANNTFDIGYVYDQTTNSEGKLSSYSDETGSTTLNYNGFGNIGSKTQYVTGFDSSTYIGFNDLTLDYDFDTNNRIVKLTYPSGLIANYEYDAMSRIKKIYLGSGQQTTIVDNVTYLPFGSVKGAYYGNNYNFTTNHDTGYRLQNYSYFKPPSYGIGASFVYDNNNNITAINRINVPNSTYGYDALDRLTNDSNGGQTFTYDKLGNRLTHQETGQSTVSYLYDPGSNRLNNVGSSSNRVYDANGNTLSKPDLNNGTMTYSPTNRMNSYSKGTTLKGQYHYNAMGQRVHKVKYKANGTVAGHFLYVYDEQGQLVHESKYSNGYHRWDRETIWLDNRPIAQFRTTYSSGVQSNTDLYYIHVDHLNTPRWLADANGTIVWSWESDAFGVTAPNEDVDGDNKTVTFDLRFPGQFYDGESDQHYNYFRDYEPQTGRYLESDPIGLEGGINTYVYVENSPLKLVDPKGLATCDPNNPDPDKTCAEQCAIDLGWCSLCCRSKHREQMQECKKELSGYIKCIGDSRAKMEICAKYKCQVAVPKKEKRKGN